MTDSYARAIQRYLRDEYNVRPKPTRYGRHPAYEFRYGDVDHVVTINSPGHPGANLLALKKQDIRRQLGMPPIKSEKEPKMKIADMLPPATAETLIAKVTPPIAEAEAVKIKSHVSNIRAAKYKDDEVRIFVPAEYVDRKFGRMTPIRYECDGQDSWTLRKALNGPHFLKSTNTTSLLIVRVKPSPDRYGMSPAEAVEVDDALLIRVSSYKNVGPGIAKTKPKPTQLPQLPAAAMPAEMLAALPTERHAASESDRPRLDSRARMLACLREIREIEAMATHRLAKLTTGRWRWQPTGEVVELEDC